MLTAHWLYYMSKMVDLVDTVNILHFFIKKSFLFLCRQFPINSLQKSPIDIFRAEKKEQSDNFSARVSSSDHVSVCLDWTKVSSNKNK